MSRAAIEFLKSRNLMLENNADIDYIRQAVYYTSKPDKWMYIRKLDFKSNDLADKSISVIKTLPIYTAKELYGRDNDIKTLEDYVNKPKQIVFLLKYNNKIYLVNNEGYTYNRYMVELTNTKGEI